MSIMQQLASHQVSAEIPVNRNFQTLEHQAVYGRRQSVDTGLLRGFYGGRWSGFSVADFTHTLNDNATVYQVVARADGASSISTSNTNWNDTTNYARVYKWTTSGGAVVGDPEDHRAGLYGVHGTDVTSAAIKPVQHIIIACSDETTALTTGAAKVTFRMPYAFTLSDVRASVTTAPTGGTLLTVDVNESGSTILSTKLTFDAGETTTTTAATPRVISKSSLADDAEITIDIDAVGSTIAGAGLKVTLIGTRT